MWKSCFSIVQLQYTNKYKYSSESLTYSSRDYVVSLHKLIGELVVGYHICKIYSFFEVFVILVFNEYLISRLLAYS